MSQTTENITVNEIENKITELQNKHSETYFYTLEDFSELKEKYPNLVIYFTNRRTMCFSGPSGIGYCDRCNISDITKEFLTGINAFNSWVSTYSFE